MINLFLENNKYDILCFSEHWLNEYALQLVNLQEYRLCSYFCRNQMRHGGVSIFSNETVNCKSINLDQFSSELHSEFCAVELLYKNTILLCIYRSPNGDINIFLELLEKAILHCFAIRSKLIIVGDFNLNFRGNSSALADLVNLLHSFGINITITDYTRITAQSSTCIDNILTNLDTDCYNTLVVDPSLSDHLAQIISLNECEKNKPKPIFRRQITERGITALRNSLTEINWDSLWIENQDCTLFASIFVDKLTVLLNKHFPLKKLYSKKKPPVQWFNNELRFLRDSLNNIKSICNFTGDFENYSILKKYYRSRVKDCKKAAYDKFICEAENKPLNSWKLVNHERNSTKNKFKLCDNSISANSFNDYFSTIAANLTDSIPDVDGDLENFFGRLRPPSNSFFLEPITNTDVLDAVRNMKNSKCTDVFGWNSELLRQTLDLIINPLVTLFNACITNGVFPDIFKVTKVIPIFKKGVTCQIENYRPISIIPIFSKVFEIILKFRLTNYFNSNKIFNCCQFGFRNKCSTSQAVIKIVSDIVEGLEEGMDVSITLCDLSRAFDCVSHSLLIEKLHFYGIRGLPLKLMQTYLQNRKQAVFVNESQSDFRVISHGVPQGSVLGPLLFIIYANDLFHYLLPYKCVAFADDTTIINFGSNLENLKIRKATAFERAENWFSFNKLKLNSDKTQELYFSTRHSVTGNSVKILGIVIDSRLSWQSHIEVLCKKLSSSIYLLRQLMTLVCFNTVRSCYFSFFHSHINYGILLWGNSCNSLKVFRLQKKVIRIIAGAGYRDHCAPLFKKFSIMPVPSLFIYATVQEIHKNKGTFSTNSEFHSYETRTANHLRVSRFRLTRSQINSLDVNLYNFLPPEVKSLNMFRFKNVVKQHILRHCFYSIEEYLKTPVCLH